MKKTPLALLLACLLSANAFAAPTTHEQLTALALAIDGAIVQAQYLASPDAAVESLACVAKALSKEPA